MSDPVADTAVAESSEPRRSGRARATTRGELSHIGLQLFLEHGFDQTTVDDIAREAGIGRRTFFRYYSSKNDLPWGEFDDMLEDMRAHLAALPDDLPMMEALRRAVIAFNRFPADEVPFHRERMRLLLNVPTLVAHSTLRYASWRQVVGDFVAHKRGVGEHDLEPRAIAWICLGLSIAAYEQWLADDDSDLVVLIDTAFHRLAEGYGTPS